MDGDGGLGLFFVGVFCSSNNPWGEHLAAFIITG